MTKLKIYVSCLELFAPAVVAGDYLLPADSPSLPVASLGRLVCIKICYVLKIQQRCGLRGSGPQGSGDKRGETGGADADAPKTQLCISIWARQGALQIGVDSIDNGGCKQSVEQIGFSTDSRAGSGMNVALREILGILYNLFLFGILHTVRVAAENGQSYLSVITIYLSWLSLDLLSTLLFLFQ